MKVDMKKYGIWAGFVGSFAALCCAGIPVFLAFLAGLGLGFVINDFILFPILFLSLGFLFYALYHNKTKHLNIFPLYLAIASALLIFVGIFINFIIWFGVSGLMISSIWDFTITKRCK
jgi:hypothetical protein